MCFKRSAESRKGREARKGGGGGERGSEFFLEQHCDGDVGEVCADGGEETAYCVRENCF